MTDILDTDEEGGGYEVGNKKPPRHTQFKKGQSGNPHRGSTKTTVAAWLKHFINQDEISVNILATKDGSTKAVDFSIKSGEGPLASLIAVLLIKGACEGNMAFIKEVIDRVEGRAKQHVEGPKKGHRKVIRDEEGNTLVTWINKDESDD